LSGLTHGLVGQANRRPVIAKNVIRPPINRSPYRLVRGHVGIGHGPFGTYALTQSGVLRLVERGRQKGAAQCDGPCDLGGFARRALPGTPGRPGKDIEAVGDLLFKSVVNGLSSAAQQARSWGDQRFCNLVSRRTVADSSTGAGQSFGAALTALG
jgi:hypothetical protein